MRFFSSTCGSQVTSKCVTYIPTFWHVMCSITEQMHSNKQSSFQLSVESNQRITVVLHLLHSVIDSKFLRHFFNQSEVKPKPIVARACTFSRALCRLPVITLSFDWVTGLSLSFLISQSNYFGFGFTTLI